MRSHHRIQVQLFSIVASIAVAGCNNMPSSTASGVPAAVAGANALRRPDTGMRFFFAYHNDIDNYVWLTRYWSYAFTTWHIDGANCVAPGQTYNGDIYFGAGGAQAKLRIEVRAKKDCQGANMPGGDLSTPKCTVNTSDNGRQETDVYAWLESGGSRNAYTLTDFKKDGGHRQPCTGD